MKETEEEISFAPGISITSAFLEEISQKTDLEQTIAAIREEYQYLRKEVQLTHRQKLFPHTPYLSLKRGYDQRRSSESGSESDNDEATTSKLQTKRFQCNLRKIVNA